jgi:DNA-binding transcriptional regulator YdaS (Cro superfamily)
VTTSASATLTILLQRPGRSQRDPEETSPGRTPRVARLLALAHEIERRIRAGELDDLAHAARLLGLTRARVTQIVSLTLLAPALQAEILATPPATRGRDVITERTLRPIVAESDWERQMAHWRSICSPGGS